MSKMQKKEDVTVGQLRFVYSDITKDLEDAIILLCTNALKALYKGEKAYLVDVAEQIKIGVEELQPGSWHVVVGKSFDSYVTHEVRRMLYFFLGQIGFLVFRHG